MRVFIDEQVYEKVNAFYYAAMLNHITLTKETVDRKIWRMEQGLQTLSRMQGFRKARLKQEWIELGLHEFLCEGFVFAYEVLVDDVTDEQIVWVRDVIHESLYH
jgi:hypothetical protein